MKVVLAVVAALGVAAPSFAKEKRRIEAGGETCPLAVGIPCLGCPGNQSINFTDTGSTALALNDNGTVPVGCPGGTNPGFTGVSGPDHVYAFSTTAPFGTTNLTITVTPIGPDAAWDPAIYVLGACNPANCRAKRDENLTGQPETIPAGVFYPAGTFAIFIDSAFPVGDPEGSGNYRIDVTGFVPVELNGFKIE